MYKRQVWPNSQSSLSVQFVESCGDVIKDHDLGGFSNGCIQSPEPERKVNLAPCLYTYVNITKFMKNTKLIPNQKKIGDL